MNDVVKSKGVVKWFNSDKGYGFLTVEGLDKDVFLHVKQLRASGFNTNPAEGETLKFVLNPGPKGSFATDISRG